MASQWFCAASLWYTNRVSLGVPREPHVPSVGILDRQPSGVSADIIASPFELHDHPGLRVWETGPSEAVRLRLHLTTNEIGCSRNRPCSPYFPYVKALYPIVADLVFVQSCPMGRTCEGCILARTLSRQALKYEVLEVDRHGPMLSLILIPV